MEKEILELKHRKRKEDIEEDIEHEERGHSPRFWSQPQNLSEQHSLSVDSKVLQMTPTTISRDIKFIRESLCRPSALKLLFRASEHSFSAEAFHEHCDKAEDTFVLVRTEFGKTIAGYSGYTWEAKED